MTSAGFAQSPWQGDGRWGSWGYQNDKDRREYNQGVRDGENDRAHGRAFHPRHSEQDYMNGYRAGFGTGGGGGWQGRRNDGEVNRGYPSGPYYPGNPNGGYRGNNSQSAAYNNGYQQGLQYGASDRNNGHSNRPTYSSTYQNGTSGYNSSMGGQTAYKQSFRQGYIAGYQRGYGGAGGRR